MEKKNIKKECLYCEKALAGREDKRFCDVDCKNNYHSRSKSELNAQGHPNTSEIIKIIKQNYKILLGYKAEITSRSSLWFDSQEFHKRGFNPNFYTSVYHDSKQNLWFCCFDICYLVEGNYNYKLMLRNQQAEIDPEK